MEEFDVIVIGGGPGGYPAAIRLAQEGKKVALIEKEKVGGTCLNRGCIPTKALIAGAHVLHKVRHASEFGIETGKVSFRFDKMAEHKTSVVDGIGKSLKQLILANAIKIFEGHGKCVAPGEVKVVGKDSAHLRAKNMILATGSEPREIASLPFDYKRVHDSTSILELTELPKSLAIIGAGYIGSEFASLYNELGVKVTLIEALPTIIPTEGAGIAQVLHQAFEKRGIDILTGTFVQKITESKGSLTLELSKGGTVVADMALVAIGRKLNTDNIGLESIGVAVEDNGAISVDDHMRTNMGGVYAIGDITAKSMLAHVASHQGLVAAEHILGKDSKMDYRAIPSIVFTEPEVASVGLSLEKALEKGLPAVAGAFPFQALGKSQAAKEVEGFAQIISHKETGEILGAQAVGYEAGTLIAEMGLAITNELTVESVSETIHAHPTIAEAWMEASLLVQGMPIHLPPKKKKK